MKCYAQFSHPELAPAYPDQYDTFESMANCKLAFQGFAEDQDRFADGKESEALVWLGTPDPEDPYPCDSSTRYPDRVLTIGARGGVVAFNC